MNLWELFIAFVLGLVEGLTEFAPVSSTGHMVIVDDMLFQSKELLSPPVANTFKVVIQIGSILATVIIFRDRFLSLFGLKKITAESGEPGQKFRLSQVIVGLLPACTLGFLFEDYIDEHLFSITTVLIALVAGSILMIAADLLRPRTPKVASLDQITHKQAFLIGLFQCLSLWPGFSRSGATISGGVLMGLNHRTASDFTFIMAVPIMMGASFLSLVKNWEYFTSDVIPFFAVGFVSAFLFAWLAIRFFLRLIDRIKLIPFALYRIAVAVFLYLIAF